MEESKEAKGVEEEISDEGSEGCEKIGPKVPEISSLESQQAQKPVEKSNIGPGKESHETAEDRTRLEGEECIEKDEQIKEVVSAANEAKEDITHEEDEDWSIPVEIPELETPEKDDKTENLATTKVSRKKFSFLQSPLLFPL